MAARASRLMSALTAGGVLAGSLLLGSASADAAPRPPGGGTVAASCGQTVTAYPGDRVKVTPAVGLPFVQNVTAGMGPVAMTVSGLLCSVNVKVLVPVAQQLTAVAPPLGQVTTKVTEGVGEVLTPKSQSAPSAALVPAPRAAAPMVPLAPTRAPVSTLPSGGSLSTLPSGQPAADAPLFAPAFSNELPSSFLSSGAPAAVAAPTTAGAGSLFGSAFPGLNTGAPAYLGYDPASAVTTASQVQALPVDGFSDGVGIPAILAVLALSGAAAFAVRRMVLGKSLIPAALTVGPAAGAVAAAPLAAPASAPVEAPAETDVERTALVGAPITDAAEVTSVTPAVPALDPAEETAVAPVLTDAEVTSVTPAVPALDPAEVTAVTPAVTDEAEDVPAETPAEVTGVIDAPVDAPADSESTGVLASAAN